MPLPDTLSIYDAFLAGAGTLVAIEFAVIALLVWHGKIRRDIQTESSRMSLAAHLMGGAVIVVFSALGDLLFSTVINGIVLLAGAAWFTSVLLLYRLPEPVGHWSRTERGRQQEGWTFMALAVLCLVGAFLNLAFAIHV